MPDTLSPEATTTTTLMSGAEMIVRALKDHGVDTIFGYPGGAILPIYDALFQQQDIKHILVRHEQAAVHAAEGYARSTGKVGAVLVTSGPGATNAVTGLTDALMDSIPIVCFSGQVPTHLIGNDAFQEADTTGITRPCTKHNYLCKDANKLAGIIHEAFHVAKSGRPGPVLIDVPKDVQFNTGLYHGPAQANVARYQPQVKGDRQLIERAVDLMLRAKKPVFYTGGGVINAGTEASRLLTELVRLTGYPITNTLMGLGAYPASDGQFLGMLGMHGTYEANLAMYNCDVMINIGARFDDRVTGKTSGFSPNSKKIHVDIDPSSINKNIVVDIGIVGDCASVLADMLALWKQKKASPDARALKAWWEQINAWRAIKSLSYQKHDTIIKPQHALEVLRDAMAGQEHYVTTEVGQHQMWAAQFLPFEKPHHWMTSGGLGTMGYGFPSAIGTQIAHPDALVVCVAGEASLQMNIQEMSTARQYNLPVKVMILNNHWMGMVRQWQELLHGSRFSSSYTEALPDFVKLAEAYGWTGLQAQTVSDLEGAVKKMIATEGPVLLDVLVDQKENCFPMIPGGKCHNEILLGPGHENSGQQDISKATPEDGLALV
jgi:acetolactate synthase-1/2/3 large subunit